MVPRRDAKRDHNEKAIVLALRNAGYLVGEGPWFCDLAVYDANADKVFFLEVKSARGKLTPTQVDAIKMGWPIKIVRSVADAFDALA